jgi:tRNA dimethylallyltransferase
MKKTCIIIAGPTAVGKTKLAIQIAQHFSTSIISADSRQCYQELNIGVAKPSSEELKSVHHYFINSHSIHESINAVDYEKYALESASSIFKNNNVAVMVGGTGLYIKAFSEGMDNIPATPAEIRSLVIDQFNQKGIKWLVEELQKKDPEYSSKGEMQNPQRMMRALEVILNTGNSILTYQKGTKSKRDFNIIKIGLELPRQRLYDLINTRVDMMIAEGLIEEAKQLIPFKSLNALQTVGYRELFDYFEGNINKQRAIELIKQNTRHYAKRQLTWFKRDENMHWFQPQIEPVLHHILQTFNR